MRRKTFGVITLALTMVFSMFMLTACGGGGNEAPANDQQQAQEEVQEEIPSLEGAWDCDELGISLTFESEDSGVVSTYAYIWDFSYTWDGETLELHVDESDMDAEGTLDEEGSLYVDDCEFVPVDEAYYTPFAISGGSEAELEGSWIHTSGDYTLTFDGSYEVAYENSADGINGIGAYGFDGQYLTIAIADEDEGVVQFNGEVDSFGDVVIELWDEGGWYNSADEESAYADDSSSAVLEGPEAELVGTWYHTDTDEYVTFESDGSVTYYIGGTVGYAYPFTYDGETLTFSDYTGEIDSVGDLCIDGVDSWFERAE